MAWLDFHRKVGTRTSSKFDIHQWIQQSDVEEGDYKKSEEKEY